MPLEKDEDFGTDADRSKSELYCIYCFQEWEFTHNMTLDEAIADSVNYAEMAWMTKEEALEHAKIVLPNLLRWKNKTS
jgi:hypothetical protein